jgi:hypothetical protein
MRALCARCDDVAELCPKHVRQSEEALLAAFEEFVDKVQCFDMEFSDSTAEHEAEEAMRVARAAIKKARSNT